MTTTFDKAAIDAVVGAIDARGSKLKTALDVLRVACDTVKALRHHQGVDPEERVRIVRSALITVLSGPDEELYTPDDVLPASVMRDITALLQTDMFGQLVIFFTQKSLWRCCC